MQNKNEVEFAEKADAMKGEFFLRVYKAGTLIEESLEENLIVTQARVLMARLLAGEVSGRSVTRIGFGTNGVPPQPSDTALVGSFVKLLNGYVFPSPGRVQFNWELLVSEGNGMSISEFGLLSAGGTLFARRNRNNPIFKEADISLEGRWTIIF